MSQFQILPSLTKNPYNYNLNKQNVLNFTYDDLKQSQLNIEPRLSNQKELIPVCISELFQVSKSVITLIMCVHHLCCVYKVLTFKHLIVWRVVVVASIYPRFTFVIQ